MLHLIEKISAYLSSRFGKYIGVGLITFSIDIALLFLLTSVLEIYYLWATMLAFACAATLNYALSRTYVFSGSRRALHSGYAISLIIAGIGLAAITGCMYLLVQVLGINYLVSRVLAAVLVGMWGYVMNLYVNFRVG